MYCAWKFCGFIKRFVYKIFIIFVNLFFIYLWAPLVTHILHTILIIVTCHLMFY